MMTRSIFIFLSIFSFSFLNAQSAVEALRYMELRSGGTARTIAIGGAIGALGADFSSLSSNPAGLGVFRKSEFILSPSLLSVNTSSILDDQSSTERRRNNFNLENIGVVFNSKPRRKKKWKAFNLGIGYNRIVSFHRTTEYEGEGSSSILENFAELSQGSSPEELYEFDANLAYSLSAIGEVTAGSGQWGTFDDFSQGNLFREETLSYKGGINEFVISLAGNFNDKFYMGITLSAPLINYEEIRTYTESDPLNNILEFEQLTFEESLSTSGIGVNLKAGIIFKPIQSIRIGLAAQTPTSLALTDNFQSRLSYEALFFESNPSEPNQLVSDEAESLQGVFDYGLSTPLRVSASAAFVQKFGFLAAEIEYVDYGLANFNLTKNSSNTPAEIQERQVNNEIENTFQSAVNIKLGAELALGKSWRLRGGYSLIPTPFDNDDIVDDLISFGAGFRGQSFYLDLAYRAILQTQAYTPYTLTVAPQPFVFSEINQNKFILTFGYRF